MENKRPLVLVPQGCCNEPTSKEWQAAFNSDGRTVNRIFNERSEPDSTISVIRLTAIEGHTSESFISTKAQDSGFLGNLHSAQLVLKNKGQGIGFDVVVVVCCPPTKAADSAMPVVVQMTADGHRVHTLLANHVNPENRTLAYHMAAAGIWQHYSFDRRTKDIARVDKMIRAIEETSG